MKRRAAKFAYMRLRRPNHTRPAVSPNNAMSPGIWPTLNEAAHPIPAFGLPLAGPVSVGASVRGAGPGISRGPVSLIGPKAAMPYSSSARSVSASRRSRVRLHKPTVSPSREYTRYFSPSTKVNPQLASDLSVVRENAWLIGPFHKTDVLNSTVVGSLEDIVLIPNGGSCSFTETTVPAKTSLELASASEGDPGVTQEQA